MKTTKMKKLSSGRAVVLTITNRCNLSCTYCYEHNKDGKDMSFDTAMKIIEEQLSLQDDRTIDFDFHGGDPMMNFDLIKKICEYTWGLKTDKRYRFFACTNGSILNSEMKEWIEANHHRFFVGLSIDGTPEMNEVNRGYKFTEERLMYFKKLYPSQTVKLTVSPRSISMLFEGVKYLFDRNISVAMSLAQGVEWDAKLAHIYHRELKKIADYYLQNPQVEKMWTFEKPLSVILMDRPTPRACGSGTQMCSYDVDGNKYPCQLFGPNTLVTDAWKKLSTFDYKNDELFLTKECAGCCIEKICPTCYGMNYLNRGDVSKRDTSLCPFYKAELKALAYYNINNISKKEFEDITEDEYLTLSASQSVMGMSLD